MHPWADRFGSLSTEFRRVRSGQISQQPFRNALAVRHTATSGIPRRSRTETFLQPAKPASRSMNQKAATLPIA